MNSTSDDTRSVDRLAARLLDAEKEVTAASAALQEFVRTGERYSASRKALDEAVIALAPVRDTLQQAVTSLGSAVAALQEGVNALQEADPVRLRQDLGAQIASVDNALNALRTEVSSSVAGAQAQRASGVAEVKAKLLEVQQVVEERLMDGFAELAKKASEAAKEEVGRREQDRANVAAMSALLAEQGEAIQRVMARVEASEAQLAKRLLGGFVVLGSGLTFLAYRLLMN